MKKVFLAFFVFAITVTTSTEITAQNFPKLDASPMDAAAYPTNWRNSNKLVKVVYSRPQLKGRTLDKLAPNDKVWRTGANEAAEITFYKDVVFGDSEVKAGTYTMFTIPGEENWTIILSNQKNVWGAYFYDKEEDVVRVTAKKTERKKLIEEFSIAFDGDKEDAIMYLGWGNTVISLPIKG